MNREKGYYWVKVKGDKGTEGDLDILMGLLAPQAGEWIIAKWDGGSWNIDSYDLNDGYWSEINEKQITSVTKSDAKKYRVEIIDMTDEEWWALYYKQKLPWEFGKWIELYQPSFFGKELTNEEQSLLSKQHIEYLKELGY